MVRREFHSSAIGRGMEEEIIDEIDTIITELEVSKGRGNIVLCVVNPPSYRDKIVQVLKGRFPSLVIKVEGGDQIIETLKRGEFAKAEILLWVMPEEPKEDILSALNNFRELFYKIKVPSLIFYNQTFSQTPLVAL